MTAQEPDLIRLEPDGRCEALCTNPLDDWLYEQGIGPRLGGPGWVRTSNWRNYVATFLVHEGHLWVEEVEPLATAVVAARRRDRWTWREDRSGQDRELEPEESWRKRAEIVNPQGRSFDLDGIFPREDESIVRDGEGRVRADWYTGELRIPRGRMTGYVHGGYGSRYERDHLVMIEKGVVIRGWTRENG